MNDIDQFGPEHAKAYGAEAYRSGRTRQDAQEAFASLVDAADTDASPVDAADYAGLGWDAGEHTMLSHLHISSTIVADRDLATVLVLSLRDQQAGYASNDPERADIDRRIAAIEAGQWTAPGVAYDLSSWAEGTLAGAIEQGLSDH